MSSSDRDSQTVDKGTPVSLPHERKANGERETLATSPLILATPAAPLLPYELMTLRDGSYFRLVPNVGLEAITRSQDF